MRLVAQMLLVAALALPVTGCGSDDGASGERTYTVAIDIPFHPLLDYVIAKQDDYFGGKSYRVRFKVLDTTTLVPAFGTGDVDVIGTFPSFLPRIEQRYGLVAQEFLPLARIKSSFAIWVPNDSTARTIDDLKGAKVATTPLGQQWGEDEAMVEAATGQKIDDFFDLQESAAPVQQLLLGRVDAAFVSGETTAQVAESGKFRPLVSSQQIFEKAYGDPAVLSGGLAAPQRFLDENKPFVADLSAALEDAWERYVRDPKPVLAAASKQSGVAPEQMVGFAKATGLADTPPAKRRVTPRDVETWTKIYAALARSGFLEREPDDAAKYFLVAK